MVWSNGVRQLAAARSGAFPGAGIDAGLGEEYEADGSHVFIDRAGTEFLRFHPVLRNVADARVAG